jgi:hypothetical protein
MTKLLVAGSQALRELCCICAAASQLACEVLLDRLIGALPKPQGNVRKFSEYIRFDDAEYTISITGAVQVRQHMKAPSARAPRAIAARTFGSASANPSSIYRHSTSGCSWAARRLKYAAAKQLHKLRREALEINAQTLLCFQRMEVTFPEHETVVEKKIRFVGQLD